MEAIFKLRLPGSSGPGLTARRERCRSFVSNVLAPQKVRSAQPQPANQEPSEQQQQPWGWGPLNGLKLQWPASNAVELEVQAQQEVRSVSRRTFARLPLDAFQGPCLIVRTSTQVPAAQESPATTVSVDVQAFLGSCSDDELRHMRMLSHLCAQTYYMGQLTVSMSSSSWIWHCSLSFMALQDSCLHWSVGGRWKVQVSTSDLWPSVALYACREGLSACTYALM